jgi:hypothetical protein
MFNLSKSKILKHTEENCDLFALSNGNDFNVNKYILQTYKSSPSYFSIDEKFDENIFDFLLENSTFIRFSSTGRIVQLLNDKKNFRGGTFWFKYKDIYLKLTAMGEDDENTTYDIGGIPMSFDVDDKARKNDKIKKKKYDLTVIAPSFVQDYHFEDFQKFITKEEGSKVHLFIKNQYGEFSF